MTDDSKMNLNDNGLNADINELCADEIDKVSGGADNNESRYSGVPFCESCQAFFGAVEIGCPCPRCGATLIGKSINDNSAV